MRVLTWNVAGRVRTVGDQARALETAPADLVLLQEVRSTAALAWVEALQAQGYDHVLASLAPGAAQGDPARRLGVVLAARRPLTPLPQPPLPWPERHLAARVEGAEGPVDVHVVHVPTSSRPGSVKVRTLEALVAALTDASTHGGATVVGGDLNTPQYESRDGEVRSFARTRTGRLREGFDERHDRAELAAIPGLTRHGYADAFRAVHGYGARDRSWLYPNGKMGYRLDHILSRGLTPAASAYVHGWREQRLSDHSALWADLRA